MSVDDLGSTPHRESEFGVERLDLILHRMDLMRGAVDETCSRIKTLEEGLSNVRTDLDKMAASNVAGARPALYSASQLTSDIGVTPFNLHDVPTDDNFGIFFIHLH
jgi:hypothetical protein